jgi:hypothetical protein
MGISLVNKKNDRSLDLFQKRLKIAFALAKAIFRIQGKKKSERDKNSKLRYLLV